MPQTPLHFASLDHHASAKGELRPGTIYAQRPLYGWSTAVYVTERLAAFIAEGGYANSESYIETDSGALYSTFDLHPDIRWCPSDVAPE